MMSTTPPQSPGEHLRERRLQADLQASGRLGTALNLHSSPFGVDADAISGALVTGPRRYMVRLRRIELGLERLQDEVRAAWLALARQHRHSPARFARAWREWVAAVDATTLNALIDSHNRWYPVEAKLPMDVRTGNYITWDGRDYRHAPVDAARLLAQFPADLHLAAAEGGAAES
jgi:hypothetical protein